MDIKKKRQKIENYFFEHLDNIDPTKSNSDRYKKLFEKMSDQQFDIFMKNLKDDKIQLYLLSPNQKVQLHLNNLFNAGHKLGIDFFERIWLIDPVTKQKYLTSNKYMILKLPIRRLKQYLEHKRSLPVSDKKIDYLTGQVIKPDQSSGLSAVEVQALYARNFINTILELIKVRGGDNHAYQDTKNKLYETGVASLEQLDPNSVVRSNVVMSQILKAMGLDNNYFGNSISEGDDK